MWNQKAFDPDMLLNWNERKPPFPVKTKSTLFMLMHIYDFVQAP